MQDHTPRRATYADVLAAPPNVVAEILDGCLVTQPRPEPKRLNAAYILGVLLAGPFQLGQNGPGGWWILDEPELHVGDDIAVPDLAGWRSQRLPRLPDTAWFGLAPDWACEVLSPSTQRTDRSEKRDLYARHGVAHLWHVDPDERLLEAFARVDSTWVLERTSRDDDEVAIAPFAAAPFKLGHLWAD
jgi:Uma2 family endonuclease